MRLRILILSVLVSLVLTAPVCAQQLTETAAQKDARLAWWRDAKFGMFIHWGLYAVPAGSWEGKPVGGAAEWLLNSARIKVADYEPLLPRFNPVKFDAKEWVRIAKDAGMKYIVITSKHHEGFAMFDSKHTDWGIMSTPFARDPLKELAKACKDEGLRLCFYHSIMDWHHPDYLPRRNWDPRPDIKADFPRYVQYMKAQLKELLTHYGPIGILWFDGEWEATWTHEQGVDLYNYVRKLQPKIIVNNRVDTGRSGMGGMSTGIEPVGDYGTPEQEIPSSGIPGKDWESCMTMNDTWGFCAHDDNWKSASTLVRNLIDCVSKGGNYLLNVGPTAEGLIPEPSVVRLAQVGEWLKRNGTAVYGAKPSPFPKALNWGRVTQKPGKLFLHVFGSERLLVDLPGLDANITKVYVLGDKEKRPLETRRSEEGWSVALPSSGLDAIATVLVAEVKGKVVVTEIPITQAADGSLTLNALDAHPHGGLRYESDKDCIGFWTNLADWLSWSFEARTVGTYSVSIEYACNNGQGESTIRVLMGAQALESTVRETGSWSMFKRIDLGVMRIDAPGKATIEVRAKEMPNGAVMNLRRVILRPILL